MNDKNRESINNYLKIYDDIKKEINVQLSNETLKTIALLYAISNRPFQVDLFEELGERIKDKVGFSRYSGELPYIIGTILIIKYDYPFTEMNGLLENIKAVEEYDLYTNYSLFIAFILLDEKDVKKRLEESRNTFYNMQDRHSFITGEEDYTFSILLSESDQNTAALMDEVEYYYRSLAKDCFKRGNSLQLLSHVLTLMDDDNRDAVIERCIYIFKTMKQQKLKIKSIIYALIGLMSVAMKQDIESKILEIKDVMEYLNNTKFFRKSKDFNLIMAILTVMDLKDYDNHTLYYIGDDKCNKKLPYPLLIAILSNMIWIEA